MRDENPIRTLGDYSKPSHEGYRNTIELPGGNNVVPLRSDTVRLVQNGCSFHGHRFEDPNQHLKDFLKLMDSLDLDGSITTWEDLTTRFLAQFFPPGGTTKLCNDILIRNIDQAAGGKLRDRNAKESWALLEDLALYDNESWNDPRDFAKPVKAIALPQDVPSTSDRRLIELKNRVQCLMEAHLTPTQPTQVNKVTTSCEICNGPHDTQYCKEDTEQTFTMAASTIGISSDSSDESVGSPPSRVILFGDIPTVIPATSVIAPETLAIALIISSAAPVVETTLVASPTGLCGLVPYSDSDYNSLNEMDSPEYITPLPATSPFLYIDSPEASDSSDGPPSQDRYVTTVARWRSKAAARSSSPYDFPIALITAPARDPSTAAILI
ncbi:hypothetical protein Tco_0494253 [Tanacetum coccineum]